MLTSSVGPGTVPVLQSAVLVQLPVAAFVQLIDDMVRRSRCGRRTTAACPNGRRYPHLVLSAEAEAADHARSCVRFRIDLDQPGPAAAGTRPASRVPDTTTAAPPHSRRSGRAR